MRDQKQTLRSSVQHPYRGGVARAVTVTTAVGALTSTTAGVAVAGTIRQTDSVTNGGGGAGLGIGTAAVGIVVLVAVLVVLVGLGRNRGGDSAGGETETEGEEGS